MKYTEVQILTTTEASDIVSNILYEEGAAGVVIEDPNDLNLLNEEENKWDYIEEELIQKMGEDVKVKGYFSELDYSEEKLNSIKERVNEIDSYGIDKGKGAVQTKDVYEEDWANNWKQYYKPLKVGEKVVIKPSWEAYEANGGEVIIELDPGMAFGTGTHETTVMCIKLLEEFLNTQSTVFDVGCGSGILGITAAKLSAKSVSCVDIDEVCCKVTRENIEMNKVEDQIKVYCGNLLDVIKEKADVIVANIIADIIIGFTPDAKKALNSKGIFISSGIIKDREEEVINKLQSEGFTILKVLRMGEWCAVAAERE